MRRGNTPPPRSGTDEAESSELAKTIAEQLSNGSYECMICTDVVAVRHAIWGCPRCFRIFHIGCTKKWADTTGQDAFRCPSCQFNHGARPKKYYCFCGKAVDPDPRGFATPHSCGEVCGKIRPNGCPHPCAQLCHPGPCAPCRTRVPLRPCPCGKTQYDYPCGGHDPQTTCTSECGKPLSCGVHFCKATCHHGPCAACDVLTDVPCQCGKSTKPLVCGTGKWNCEAPCGKTQRCGNHQCNVVCHSGSCPPCDGDPSIITTCPCGKVPLKQARKTCVDPIPLCGQVCGKVLLCGSHYCEQLCHTGPCGDCSSKIELQCPCHSTRRKVPCKDASHFRCTQKCKTKMSCGRHECENLCCLHKGDLTSPDHICRRRCNKQLPCGHVCEDPCHKGNCARCHHIVTTELTCRCGREVLFPPQPCGTEPPQCMRPCMIPLPCGHPSVPHNCHFGDCPPCMRTVTRMCVGGHVELKAVLCNVKSVTCSNLCAKPLPCGHPCPKKCHEGPCIPEEKKKAVCSQICSRTLPCGHACQMRCHADRPCGPCAAKVEIFCECGVNSQILSCKEYLARKEEAKRSNPPTPIPEGEAPREIPIEKRITFPCTDDCLHKRRLEALQSLSAPKSSAHRKTYFSLKVWSLAKKDIDSIVATEKQLAAFLKESAPSLMLPSMPREKRQIVHELCWYYHIDSVAVDQEPQRSCYLTRTPKSAAPSPLLSEAVYDDNENPNAIALKVLKSSEAQNKVLVMEGPELNDTQIQRLLKAYAGQLIIVPHEELDTRFFIVFPWGGDAGQAFSFLRRQGTTGVTYWRYGDEPLSVKQATPLASPASAKTPAATTSPSTSWASMMRQQKKKDTKNDALDTKNSFSPLLGDPKK